MKPSINKMDPAEDAEHGRERVGEQVSTSMNSDRRESLLDVAVGDAFGQSLVAYLNDGSSWHAIERDDGLLEVGGSAKYFALPAEWDPLERLALNRAGVNVLDLGCGAGRAALALQERGKKVLAVDTSAGAIGVCQRRGVRETLHGDVSVVSAQDFDTVVMLGSGLGLLESSERAPLVLEQLERVTSQSARILAEGLDPVFGEVPAIHAAYHAMNRSRGLLPGQIRLRVRFRELSTPWFDWLFCSPSELRLNAL